MDETLYRIACMFLLLKRKNVEQEQIPGITSDEFDDEKLTEFLYEGPGACWPIRETLLLEFLLNLSDPYTHTKFNLGWGMYTWDVVHLMYLIKAIIRFYDEELTSPFKHGILRRPTDDAR